MINGSGRRKFNCWIEAFQLFTVNGRSPEVFRKWSAIGAVSAALERRCFIKMNGKIMFPNQYILLVAGPATGKSAAISEIEAICRKIEDMRVSPSNVSKASLIDAIAAATRKIVPRGYDPGEMLEFNSLFVIASEFGVFLSEYAGDFVTLLTKMWDNEYFEERKRTGDKHLIIEKPQLNLLGGTTPSALATLLPEGAWDQGFTSRNLLIFSDKRTVTDPFAEFEKPESFADDLAYDLRIIMQMQGEFRFADDAKALFREWVMTGAKPAPNHPKLVHYIGRRDMHVGKLAIAFSASRGDSKIISMKDLEDALEVLFSAELAMPEIFKSMSIKGGDSAVVDEAHHFVVREYISSKNPIPHHRIVAFLQQRVAPYSVMRIIENMVSSQHLRAIYPKDGVGGTMYVPLTPDI